jgi:hypothetical protein
MPTYYYGKKNIFYKFLLSHITHICMNFNVDMTKEYVWFKTKVMAMVHAQGGHVLYSNFFLDKRVYFSCCEIMVYSMYISKYIFLKWIIDNLFTLK